MVMALFRFLLEFHENRSAPSTPLSQIENFFHHPFSSSSLHFFLLPYSSQFQIIIIATHFIISFFNTLPQICRAPVYLIINYILIWRTFLRVFILNLTQKLLFNLISFVCVHPLIFNLVCARQPLI